nr:programmed cell death protein 2 [Hymenolepis microstoma]
MATVFCGFPDEEPAQQQPSAVDSYIGGVPTTFSSSELCCSAPLCPTCGELMYFVLQLYCPIDSNHRNLYFYTCPNKECQISGRFFRVFRFTTNGPEEKDEETSTLPTNEWNFDYDDIGEDKMELDHVSTPIPGETRKSRPLDNLASPFKCLYITVLEDEVQDSLRTENLHSWVLDYKAEDEFIEEDGKIEGVLTLTPLYSQHMASRDPSSGLEPIRYAFEGRPIFTSAPPSDEWESQLYCPKCQKMRVFEVQLFPTINNYLHFKKNRRAKVPKSSFNALWPLNFSTLMVFSCQGDCPSTSEEWVEECVLVQTEEGESVFVGSN